MDKKTKDALSAYQKTISGGKNANKNEKSSAAKDDWLSKFVENDFKLQKVTEKVIKTKAFNAKTPKTEEKNRQKDKKGASESKTRRVAKFLILIGADEAAKVLANLESEQVEQISREIASIRGIDSAEAAEILDEFNSMLYIAKRYGGAAQGGVDAARRLLYAAFGPEKGEGILCRAAPQAREEAFSFLEEFSGEQILALLQKESPATGAVVLSRISPKLSAKVLSAASSEWRADAVRRIARLGRVQSDILEKIAETLKEKARNISASPAGASIDGAGTLAAILKHSDLTFGELILNELSESNAELSRSIKEKLWTLDDVIAAEDKPIRLHLQELDSKDIAVLIYGRPEPFKEKILGNISQNRRAEVEAEALYLGAVPKKEAEAAVKEFMNWFRSAREKGAILMLGDELVD